MRLRSLRYHAMALETMERWRGWSLPLARIDLTLVARVGKPLVLGRGYGMLRKGLRVVDGKAPW
jgi:hypothetical protein